MSTRILKPNTTLIAVRSLNHICMIDSFRSKSHGSTELQQNDHHNEIDHHDLYKATLDCLLKGRRKLARNGAIAFILSFIYLKTVIITRPGALTKSSYDVIGYKDFPGSKYE